MTKEDKGDEIYKTDYFEEFLEREGIPVYRGYSVDNIRELKLGPWKRTGSHGACIRLTGTASLNAAFAHEFAPGDSLKPQRHLCDEIISVLEGEGSTAVWYDETKKRTVEWEENTVFKIPLNAWFQHSNSGSKPVRLVSVTDLPIYLSMLASEEFVFDNPYISTDLKRELEDGKLYSSAPQRYIVRDLTTMKLEDVQRRGSEARSLYGLFAPGLRAHIAEIPVGRYKKAHRHGPGAHVRILSGKGYSLIWRKGTPKMRFDWGEGNILVPPARWFHQHFNTGKEPARYLAIHSPIEHQVGAETFENRKLDQIEYSEEDLEVRSTFEAELLKENIPLKMDPLLYAKKRI